MKKKFNRYRTCSLFAIGFMLLFNQLAATENIDVEKPLEKLTQQLKLNEEQIVAVREILREADIQKVTDRQTLTGDALALIQAAWERRKNVDSKIKKILDHEQKELYKQIQKDRREKMKKWMKKEKERRKNEKKMK